jgi:hypothetical protein
MKLACETGKQIVELEMMSINSVWTTMIVRARWSLGGKATKAPRQGLGPSAQAASDCSLQGGDT